ncbi:uncharacterized protein LAESUDRAFT_725683 [Laetiporus sulphureus 93-53]|uniref:PHD-type domain-containing protein n=1 Tax=Laetiporus sulphureus 93-53 TaxID=1314785 RepID=A0A165EFA9_9APHY|nr:uncharacterized protein LAESUDRAFT_725683 [Laetiporus sulphureus 93-53]KZT06932.1 hypothetical protein LAESUDRAFT_725683 [Laetiporus sulphureus 93-53]
MASRRLAISSLLCADDQPNYPPPSGYAQRHSASPLSPSHTSAPSSLQPVTPAEELIGDRPKGTLDVTSASIASHESPSRDVVPLSLQPVQLRRHTPPSDDEARLSRLQPRTDHDPHVPKHIEGSTDAVRRSSPIPHHYELSSYHSRGPHPLAEESSHDFAGHPPELSHDLFAKSASHGNSHPSARPSSSRSTQSDSLSHPHSYAKPSPYLRASHSPSHSSPSSYSLPLPQRQSSHSPVLSVRASPVNYFQPVGQTHSIYAGVTSHHQSGSSSIRSPVLTGPGMSPSHFSSQQLEPVRTLQTHSTHQMIPQLVDQSFGVRTALASTPKVATAASPTTRSGEGLAGLEALAQVATEERSRLSGEATSSNQVGGRISPVISRSPVSARTVTQSPVIPQPELKSSSPTSSREALDLCGHSLSVTTEELSSTSDIPCTDGEPPRKKHRKSGAYSPRSSAVELSPVVLCEPVVPLMDNPLPVSSPSALRSAGGPLKQNTGIHSGRLGGHLVTETSTGRATFVDDPSVGEEHPHQAAIPLPSDGGRDNNVTGSHEAQEKKEKKRRERPPPRTAAHSASKDHGKRVTVHEENASREEDPHDWLLEQYSAASPSGTTAQVTRTDEQTSQLHSSHGASGAMDELAMRHSSGRDASRSPDKPMRNPTRTPTPSALLEEELDEIIHSHQPSRNDVARDVDMEFDVAASVSSAHAKEMDDLMDIDVDNELLSLLDDQPHESYSSRHKRSQQIYKRSKSSHSSSAVIVAYPDRLFPDGLSADDRDSMPPPASPSKDESKGTFESMSAAPTHKKKDALLKPAPKSKAPPKSKEKSTTKAKPKNNKDAVGTAVPGYLAPSVSTTSLKSKKTPGPSNAGVKRTGSYAAGPSRSRSTSIMPGGSVGPDTDNKGQSNEVEEKDSERDDKLYCICKTGYDEDRVMIACDRCDEWYHTQCVNMPDLEVDLVDQFICPICVENNPGLNLKTTYKRRCLYGLEHPDPTSASACHKPARGIFSKFCSDECGILCMQSRMNGWQGDKHRLWESVKESQKREGVVVRVLDDTCARTKPDRRGQDKSPRDQDLSLEVVQASVMKGEREIARLHGQLHKIAKRRDELKKDMEVVLWREKLVRLASERADGLDECGWDQRLCFDEEEYAEFGADALDSYKEAVRRADEDDADAIAHDNMQAEHGEWWCKGKKKCDRHAGWQKMRLAEIEYEREVQEKALSRLTAEEREIRKKIEDGMDVGARGAQMASPTTPLQPLNGAATVNGHPQVQTNGDAVKKGKKKKH